MNLAERGKVILFFIWLLSAIVAFSFLSPLIWEGKPEKVSESQSLVIQSEMTVAEFGQKNHLPDPILKKVFGLETKSDLQKKLSEFNFSKQEIESRVDKAQALSEEYESKNWVKIPIKFALWITFLGVVFRMMRRERITPKNRKGLYLAAIAVFGVLLGSDPSPMGTVKDAIALLGAKGVIFPPRMVALSVFLVMVLLANKFICSWGCQFGTLQDLIFRLNRSADDKKGIFRQFKIPFAFSNGMRVIFFAGFTLVAFLWAKDVIEPIDPFKIYKPAMLGVIGASFLGGLMIASLFVYRPWCHFFCAFGLVGWLVEKISIFKVQVDYNTCVACESCARACPSTVMNAILKQESVIPDCFACGTCLGVCPTRSIHLLSGKRAKPPAGKFKVRGQSRDESAVLGS